MKRETLKMWFHSIFLFKIEHVIKIEILKNPVVDFTLCLPIFSEDEDEKRTNKVLEEEKIDLGKCDFPILVDLKYI